MAEHPKSKKIPTLEEIRAELGDDMMNFLSDMVRSNDPDDRPNEDEDEV
jgi:hypothetical protein